MLEPTIGWQKSQCLWKWGIREERKDQAEMERRRPIGTTKQMVCLNAPRRRDAIKRSRSRGWKRQQEGQRCVPLRGLRGWGIHLAAARGGGGEDTFVEAQRGWRGESCYCFISHYYDGKAEKAVRPPSKTTVSCRFSLMDGNIITSSSEQTRGCAMPLLSVRAISEAATEIKWKESMH